jgi:hypothetical protein
LFLTQVQARTEQGDGLGGFLGIHAMNAITNMTNVTDD